MNSERVSRMLRTYSLILDYPVYEGVSDFIEQVRSVMPQGEEAAEAFLDALACMNIVDVQKEYVESFDMNSSAPLYLTAWELGDSRNRGNALIDIKKLIASYKFSIVKQELPDYIPLILEFLSEIPYDEWPPALETRLQAYFSGIVGKVGSRLYSSVIEALGSKFRKREDLPVHEPVRADTGEMPFPVRYDGSDY
ncbi:nitrate reductase 2 subunit delta [Thermoplasmatales archaeon]|nr:nitrate reductase 2 subunit delta [Thermoplasmatales archaeon]